MRLDAALWRAVGAFRFAALLYAVASGLAHAGGWAHPGAGVAVLVAMAGWSVVVTLAYAVPARRTWPLLTLDLGLTVAAQVGSLWVLSTHAVTRGDPTLTVSWAAAPVLAWAVRGGWHAGAAAATVTSVGAVVERGGLSQATVNSVVLLLLAGLVVGYVVTLARRAETAYAEAVRLQAAVAERERLARQVHDGVLQALALVSRSCTDPQLAALAGDQERSLRRLVAVPAALPAGELDLRALLPVRAGVELATPAGPVLLAARTAAELADAVAAAVDNALRHGGSTAWLLVEDEPAAVTVSVRDDGPGIPAGRLAQASRDGRLGVAQSIRGRVEDLGGSVTVTSTPGQGTEVELRVPR